LLKQLTYGKLQSIIKGIMLPSLINSLIYKGANYSTSIRQSYTALSRLEKFISSLVFSYYSYIKLYPKVRL